MRAVSPEIDASAHGIIYREMMAGLSLTHFECTKIKASALSIDTCVNRYRTAKDRDEVACSACRGCVVGRIHAGEGDPLKEVEQTEGQTRAIVALADEQRTCCRCGRGGMRLIRCPTAGSRHMPRTAIKPAAVLCVSCFNREAEHRRGRDAKGKPPVNYIEPTDRLVGVLVDGQPTWRMVRGQNHAEPIARTIRASDGAARFHGLLPGTSTWSDEREQFEYRTPDGEVLLEVRYGNEIGYLPVDPGTLRWGEHPATPMMPTQVSGVGFVAEWLAQIEDEDDTERPGPEWRGTSFVCRACNGGQVQARRQAGMVQARCPACLDTTEARGPLSQIPRANKSFSTKPTYFGSGS